MTLIDANLILYAYDSHSPRHDAAKKWLEAAFSGPERAGLGWITILAFLRIGTSLRLMQQPLGMPEALATVSGWLREAQVEILNPTERHWEIFHDLMVRGQAQSSLISDAHLAALAIEHGATLATADRDFSRFPGLRVMNPLED